MPARSLVGCLVVLMTLVVVSAWSPANSHAAGDGQPTDWHRFYYYPYVYYPHNFQRPQGSFDHLYYRYPPNRQIPVFNEGWYNFYKDDNQWHKGHAFTLDVF